MGVVDSLIGIIDSFVGVADSLVKVVDSIVDDTAVYFQIRNYYFIAKYKSDYQ